MSEKIKFYSFIIGIALCLIGAFLYCSSYVYETIYGVQHFLFSVGFAFMGVGFLIVLSIFTFVKFGVE